MSGKLVGLISQWFNAAMGVKDLRAVDTDGRIAAADKLADAEADYEVADPAPTMPDLWAAERAIVDLPDDCTIDDLIRSSIRPPAGAAAPPAHREVAAAPPSAAADDGSGAGGSHADEAAIARVVAPVLRVCGITSSRTTAEIVAREITHFFDVIPKPDDA